MQPRAVAKSPQAGHAQALNPCPQQPNKRQRRAPEESISPNAHRIGLGELIGQVKRRAESMPRDPKRFLFAQTAWLQIGHRIVQMRFEFVRLGRGDSLLDQILPPSKASTLQIETVLSLHNRANEL